MSIAASGLQQRTLTALLLVPLAVAAVLLLPTPYLALILALIVQLGAWEWTALAGISSFAARFAYLFLMAACLLLLWQAPLQHWYLYLLVPTVLWWLGLAIFLFRVRTIERATGIDPALIPAGLLVLIGPWVAIVHLHARSPDGPMLVLVLLILIWVADSVAFFAGRRWGREKLAPVLSPGKTRVGVYGGLMGAGVCGLLLAWGMDLPTGQGLLTAAICTLTAFVSVIGDLYESLLKRRRGMKDSGRLLPGHGGVLDRIDSLTAAAPVFTLGILWMEAGL
ncbi:MAG: phosphatidate cytidylyltransferase [Pseudomonadota bacterium]|nr:phosphatidate cytidylyltransferase [Pseudomonadota bacterium]